MISHELAKKLKDAGFKQDGEGKYYSSAEKLTVPIPESDIERLIYVPTLSEVIRAFGIRHFLINRVPIDRRRSDTWPLDKDWHACSENNLGMTIHAYGNSPEEASCLLWIETQIIRTS